MLLLLNQTHQRMPHTNTKQPNGQGNILTLPCKPYVKRFLINQFGNPADLRKNRYFFNYLKMILERKICRYNKRIHFKKYGKIVYSEEVKILIDNDTFNRFGFDVSATSISAFNGFLEDYIKQQARVFIFASVSFGQTWVNAIKDFQDTFGFSEDDFSTDSIKKDLQRHKDFLENIEKTFGACVPNIGASVP